MHKVKIFYAYSRKDKAFIDELAKHLKHLKRMRIDDIESWYDREIMPGEDWAKRIDKELNSSDVILLLISVDFLDSDYCYNIEMKRALERHEAGDAHVIPVILRPVYWKNEPFAKLQVLPTDGRPIKKWRYPGDAFVDEEAFVDVAKSIDKVITNIIHTKQQEAVVASSPPPPDPVPMPPTPDPIYSEPMWKKLLKRLNRRRPQVFTITVSIFLLFIILPFIYPIASILHHPPPSTSCPLSISWPDPKDPKTGIGVYPDESCEDIGLSDGSYALDIEKDQQYISRYRPGSNSKISASDALRKGDIGVATALWNEALSVDSNDAEAKIYLEDQRVITSGKPYVTVVIGSVLADKPVDYASRDELQGAYIAQKEYNDAAKVSGGLLLRLLIAKSGNNPFNSMKVANQIVQAALSDKTIIGVLGWATTRCSLNVLSILTNAHIPLLASSAAGDDLTSRSSYFFRVVPQNKKSAPVLAKYVETKLKLQRLVAVYEEKDAFSQNFVDTFTLQLTNDGQQAPTRLTYEHLSTPEKMAQVIQRVLEMQPDGVLLASSRSTDIANFRAALPRNSNVKVLASGVQYANANAPPGEYPDTPGLIFVSSGFPDEWSIIKPSLQAPSFFNEYKGQFDPYNQHGETPYGYRRPDSFVMLAYDAMITLLKGIQIASVTHKEGMTGEDLQQALLKIKGPQAVQGVAGQISFGADHDPVNKEIVVLQAEDKGLQLKYYQGCFLIGDTDCGGHFV